MKLVSFITRKQNRKAGLTFNNWHWYLWCFKSSIEAYYSAKWRIVIEFTYLSDSPMLVCTANNPDWIGFKFPQALAMSSGVLCLLFLVEHIFPQTTCRKLSFVCFMANKVPAFSINTSKCINVSPSLFLVFNSGSISSGGCSFWILS